MSMKRGSLTVVGTGHKIAQITPAATACIQGADKVFYAVDPVAGAWLRKVNPTAESLDKCYAVGKDRLDTYEEMVERILEAVRRNLKVCVAFYGHPGVFAYSPHEAIRRAQAEGFSANMLPGISAEDCLWADLEIDPSLGYRGFEATDFLVYTRRLDTSTALILWQIGLIAVDTYYEKHEVWNPEGLRVLTDVLEEAYSPTHKVIVYESAAFSICRPLVQHLPLARLPQARITTASTLYVPPLRANGLARPERKSEANAHGGPGTMTVVGLGYGISSQVTPEAMDHIRRSDKFFFLTYDPVTERWLEQLHPAATSLKKIQRKPSASNLDAMVERMLSAVSEGLTVCAAFSGHPAVCLSPSHDVVRRVRRRGFPAQWIPGISAMDCLFADLGIDPGDDGYQLFDATELLERRPNLDPRIPLIVLQPGVIDSNTDSREDADRRARLIELTSFFKRHYSPSHKITLYETAVFPNCDPIVRNLRLSSLPYCEVTFFSTLYIPPSGSPPLNLKLLKRLGLSRNDFESN
jgi:uncharacterized protein YabN with tetrapyrrole methylase and pyrophosphatase domain